MERNDYNAAIPYFNKSSETASHGNPTGISAYVISTWKTSRKPDKISKRLFSLTVNNPLAGSTVLMNMEKLNRRNGALDAYEHYLELKHDNLEMNEFALQRINELREAKRKKRLGPSASKNNREYS